MWWLLIIPAVFIPAFAYTLHWLDATADKREIDRMADASRKKDMRSAIQFR